MAQRRKARVAHHQIEAEREQRRDQHLTGQIGVVLPSGNKRQHQKQPHKDCA